MGSDILVPEAAQHFGTWRFHFCNPSIPAKRPPAPQILCAIHVPFGEGKMFSGSWRPHLSATWAQLFQEIGFLKAPWRRDWRLAGRAIQVLICTTGDGFPVWKLKQVAPLLRSNFAQLRAPDFAHTCVICGGYKWHTSLLVADATQMYEQVNTDLVISAFDANAAQLQDLKGVQTITVSRSRPVKGWAGGSEHTRSRSLVVFSMAQLRRMMLASCALRFATIGDIVVKARGIVIGGLLSMIAAEGPKTCQTCPQVGHYGNCSSECGM